MIRLLCGGIGDIDIRMASLFSSASTTSALILLLVTYSDQKSPYHLGIKNPEQNAATRLRSNVGSDEKCFACNQLGHVQSQCFKNKQFFIPQQITCPATQMPHPASKVSRSDFRGKTCTFCKKNTKALLSMY